MQKNIELKERNVLYTLKINKRAKCLRLSVHSDGAFVVTVPRNIRVNIIEKFIIQKAQWILDKIDYFNVLNESFPIIKHTKVDFLKYKNIAKELTENKVSNFNKIYNFKLNKINIKNQKTRWGSCSKKGNINFNYKISLLPERLSDYIVVHELCHLGEFNHSQKFWDLVAQTIPDYLDTKKELRKCALRFN